MAKVNVNFNYGVAGKEFNVEPQVGRKNVIIQTEKFYIEATIVDKVTMEANAKWITTYHGSKMKYQEVVALLEGLEKPKLTKFQVFQQVVSTIQEFQGLNEQEIKIVSLVKEGKNIDDISEVVGLAKSTLKDKIHGRKGKPGIEQKISA